MLDLCQVDVYGHRFKSRQHCSNKAGSLSSEIIIGEIALLLTFSIIDNSWPFGNLKHMQKMKTLSIVTRFVIQRNHR